MKSAEKFGQIFLRLLWEFPPVKVPMTGWNRKGFLSCVYILKINLSCCAVLVFGFFWLHSSWILNDFIARLPPTHHVLAAAHENQKFWANSSQLEASLKFQLQSKLDLHYLRQSRRVKPLPTCYLFTAPSMVSLLRVVSFYNAQWLQNVSLETTSPPS